LLDNDLNAYLLEINSRASLNINEEVEVSKGVMEEQLCELDRHVKTMVINDAIGLIQNPDAQYVRRYGSLEKIIPASAPYECIISEFSHARYLFNKLLGPRNKQIIQK